MKTPLPHYVFGLYGADRTIYRAFREVNWPAFPMSCSCVVMSQEPAKCIYEHLLRHFSTSIDGLRKPNELLMERFDKNYVSRYDSDIRILQSEKNLSFGNFALMDIDTCLPQISNMMIFPGSIMYENVDSVLGRLEHYLIGHGILPDTPSEYTLRAYESVMNLAMFNNANPLSGVYMCTPVTMSDGSTLIAYERGDNGTVECHFKNTSPKAISGSFNIWKAPMSSLSMCDVDSLKPMMMEFLDRFKAHVFRLEVPSENLSPKEMYDRLCQSGINLSNTHKI